MDEHGGGADVIFDQKDFLERVDSDMELARQVGEMFMADAREKIAAIRDLINKNHAGELVNAAHSLKGASANISALRLRRIAADLENAAKNEDIAGARGMIGSLENAIAEFESELKRHDLL
ncbi:MAG: Hpt domain-containing protein [Desulfobacterales bacterium]